jgi:hypothetical protein
VLRCHRRHSRCNQAIVPSSAGWPVRQPRNWCAPQRSGESVISTAAGRPDLRRDSRTATAFASPETGRQTFPRSFDQSKVVLLMGVSSRLERGSAAIGSRRERSAQLRYVYCRWDQRASGCSVTESLRRRSGCGEQRERSVGPRPRSRQRARRGVHVIPAKAQFLRQDEALVKTRDSHRSCTAS